MRGVVRCPEMQGSTKRAGCVRECGSLAYLVGMPYLVGMLGHAKAGWPVALWLHWCMAIFRNENRRQRHHVAVHNTPKEEQPKCFGSILSATLRPTVYCTDSNL